MNAFDALWLFSQDESLKLVRFIEDVQNKSAPFFEILLPVLSVVVNPEPKQNNA